MTPLPRRSTSRNTPTRRPRPCRPSAKRTYLGRNLLPKSGESSTTEKKLAKLAGVSHDTIAKAEYISQRANEKTKDKLRHGQTTIHSEYKRLKKEEASQAKDKRKNAAVVVLPDDKCKLIVCDISDAAKHVKASSVHWIITDPPYPKDYLPLYDHLAKFAEHALKPGGSLLVMVGQSYLPDLISRLSKRLTYHWTLAYLTPGGQAVQLWGRKVNTFWKPILWFVKGKYAGDWVGDVCQSKTNDNDKQHHQWGQSESGMRDVVRRFTCPGEVVCDPFLGGGTTGVVAVAMNRPFVGLDRDETCIGKARQRIHATEG